MNAMLWRLPFLADIMSARDAKLTRTRRNKALDPQIHDINIRKRTLQVDKHKRKCII